MKKYLFALLALQLIAAIQASAVQVAFLRLYDGNGNPIEMTPGGAGFAHVAIGFQGRWFHAHPFGGVQVSTDLSAFGSVEEVLDHPSYDEPSMQLVQGLLGQPYDHDFQWGGDTYYCSELVGLLLGVAPVPMSFVGPYWDAYFAARGNPPRPQGLGISPDGLFEELLQRGFYLVGVSPSCQKALTP